MEKQISLYVDSDRLRKKKDNDLCATEKSAGNESEGFSGG